MIATSRKLVLILFLIISVAGCRTRIDAPQGHKPPVYGMGELRAELPYDMAKVFPAAERAVDELGLQVIEESADALAGQLVVRDSQGRKIIIKMDTTAEQTVKTSIRVGMFGDRTKSVLIYNQIIGLLK